MPTAAKLVGALVTALVAFGCAWAYGDVIPDGRPVGLLPFVSAAIGLCLGWFSLGPAATGATSLIDGMASGLRVVVTVAIAVAAGFGTCDMLIRAMAGRYDTVLDALLAIFYRTIELGTPALNADLIMILLLGGLGAGAVTYGASRRWK